MNQFKKHGLRILGASFLGENYVGRCLVPVNWGFQVTHSLTIGRPTIEPPAQGGILELRRAILEAFQNARDPFRRSGEPFRRSGCHFGIILELTGA